MTGQQVESLLRYIQRLTPRASADHLTDVGLLHCFAQGRDESAFEALIRRHGPLVWRVCWHTLYNTHDAEDAFQRAAPPPADPSQASANSPGP